jgi:hypothetical protein
MVYSFGGWVIFCVIVSNIFEEGIDYVLGNVLLFVSAEGETVSERSVLKKYHFFIPSPAAWLLTGLMLFDGMMIIVLFLEISISAIKGYFI